MSTDPKVGAAANAAPNSAWRKGKMEGARMGAEEEGKVLEGEYWMGK